MHPCRQPEARSLLRRIASPRAAALLALLALAFSPAAPAAAEEEVPAVPFPFPDALTNESLWDDPAFLGAWRPQTSPSTLSHRTFAGPAEIFGHRPHFITGRFDGDRLVSISVVFLDSGTFFGYVPSGKNAPNAEVRQQEFDALFATILGDVSAGLRKLSGKIESRTVLGVEPLLRREVSLSTLGDLASRLTNVEGQLVKLSLYRSPEAAASDLDPAIRETEARDLAERLKARTVVTPRGDHLINDIPLFPQGNRAYCGVSTLAMAMQYLGLTIETEDYAAAAGIRYGSARGAQVREVYHAAAKEAGLRMHRTTRFDFARARESIEAGIPVVVWRRFSFERDYLHSALARRIANGEDALLPEADAGDRNFWPGESAPNHASIINGYNAERGEVIFTESWGEYTRNRRMRAEEMEGTAYYAFYLGY